MKQMLLPYRFAKENQVLLLPSTNKALELLTPKINPSVIAECQRFTQQILKIQCITPELFNEKLAEFYQSASQQHLNHAEDLGESIELSGIIDEFTHVADLLENDDDAPVIRLLNGLLNEAIKNGASDVHLECFEKNLCIRFRMDGVLRVVLELPRKLAPLILSRIKIMARLDIAEKRVPQDGRITVRVGGWPIDLRVSLIPTIYGERAVLRLLDKRQVKLEINELGLKPQQQQAFNELLHKPYGIILVTGPTGSGKTTTLYAALSELNEPGRNILTVEDPIEYNISGIGQTQVNRKVDMTFSKGLRAILRQDPDVVMVGEIRDLETASMAIQASQTGHLVLSTLHTNDAISAITRLRDMGSPSFLLASSLSGIIAQRLVRLLCSKCKQPYPATQEEQDLLQLHHEVTLYRAQGCLHCSNTGYKGRCGIYEFFIVNQKIRDLIHADASLQAIYDEVGPEYCNMKKDGLEKVLAGQTSLTEVFRVTE